MFSRLFKTPKSSLQLFRKNQAAMLPNDAESPQFPSENFSSLPIIWKVGLGRERSVITKHIGNAIKEGEIDEKRNVQYLHIANSDRPVKIYDLDVVISVGYRVKSLQGTLFRRWATRVLRELLLRRYEDLKNFVALEDRVDALEGDVVQIKQGMDYLVRQVTVPPADSPMRKIGFVTDRDGHGD